MTTLEDLILLRIQGMVHIYANFLYKLSKILEKNFGEIFVYRDLSLFHSILRLNTSLSTIYIVQNQIT